MGDHFGGGSRPMPKSLGWRLSFSDDNESYSVATAELGLSHQLCIAHVRKCVTRRVKFIYEQAEKEGACARRLEARKAQRGSRSAKGTTQRASRGGRLRDRAVASRIPLWTPPPTRKGPQTKEVTAAYRMRMHTL